jgi:hypothetical protein
MYDVQRNFESERPETSCGYWKPRKSPARERWSTLSLRRSCPSSRAFPPGHLVLRMAHQGIREGALARTVRAHQRRELPAPKREVDSFQDLLARDLGMKVDDLEGVGLA